MTAPSEAEPESEDEIPEIPEIGESGTNNSNDITMQVASAPGVNVQVSTMADLDRDLSSSLPFGRTARGIDLKLLTNALSPRSELEEPDQVWDFVPLFTGIKGEISRERDAQEQRDDAETAPGMDML